MDPSLRYLNQGSCYHTGRQNFVRLFCVYHLQLIRAERLPNGPSSPRRGETATQLDRGRGGRGVLGTVSSQRQSFIDHLSKNKAGNNGFVF